MTHNVRRTIAIAATSFFIFLAALFWWFQKSPLKTLTMPQLLAAYQDELQLPGQTISQAAAHLKTPEGAYRFVRDEITLSSYYARQQSPEEVLRTRFANVPDKAALLAELIKAQGWEAKFLYSDNYYKPAPVTQAKKSPASKTLKEILRRLDIDQKTYEADWQALQNQSEKWFAAQNEQTKAAFDLLKEVIDYSPNYAHSTYGPYYGTRVFVQAEKDGKTKLFDLITYDRPLEDYIYDYDLPAPHMPVVELRLRHGDGLEQTLLRAQKPIAHHQFAIRFLPTIAPLDRLAGPANPETIGNWTPVLIYDGELTTGTPFSIDGKTPSLQDKPPVMQFSDLQPADPETASLLEIARTDFSNWPQIRLSLKIESSGEGVWLPSHFAIRDNDALVKPRLLNINQEQKKLLILTDVSYSMGDIDAFDVSKEAIIDLIAQLPPQMPVGLSSFAGSVTRLIPLQPLDDRQAYEEAVKALEMQSSTGIFYALADAANMDELENGVVILLTDGYDNVGGSEEEVVEALKARNIRVFAIALGNDSDSELLQRIAEKTGGTFQKIRTAKELEPFYARLGTELTSYVVLEYEADTAAVNSPLIGEGNSLSESDDTIFLLAENISAIGEEGSAEEDGMAAENDVGASSTTRQISITLRNSSLQAQTFYQQPNEQKARETVQLILHVEYNVDGFQEINRTLLDFSDPELPWKLIGDYRLIEDLSSYPATRLEAAYIANWQKAWALKTGQEDFTSPMAPLDYGQILFINGFRALSRYDSENPTYLANGPNLYLTRSWINPQNGGTARQVFDFLYRYDRGEGGENTWDEVAMDMASARAEGIIIGGENGIDILQKNADSLQLVSLDETRPEWVSKSLWQEALRYEKDYDYLIASPKIANWVWQINKDFGHEFRALYDEGYFLAKGSSAQNIAQQFEKIDKILQLYESATGNFAGLIPTTGAQLSAIASFKREELKLWCFSTVMMGYVGEAIEDEDALLNQRGPEAAKSKAARLCKLKGGSPDNGRDFIMGAVKQAAEDGVRSFVINAVKEGAGSGFSNPHSLWDTGGKLSNAAASFNSSATINGLMAETSLSPAKTPPMPMTPRFHQAMADTLGGQ